MSINTMRAARAAATLGLATLALVACACCTPSPYDTAAGPASTAPGSAASGQAGNAVTITSIDGATLAIPAGRPAVLFFFTVGCGACETGGQALAQARQQASGKADFLLVDLDPSEPPQAIDYFRQATGDPDLPVSTIGSLDLVHRWNITQLSTAIVIDTTGTVTYRAVDPSTQDLLDAIEAATR